jgi:ABC-type nitrate/sulfonate/bicarbonate transport system substrate-binding protein
MKTKRKTWRQMAVPIAAILAVLPAAGCRDRADANGNAKPGPLRLGYVGGPHAAAVYVADEQAAQDGRPPVFTGVPFKSSGDIGYALIAGEIEAGFIETTKAAALLRSVNGLRAVGAVTFPYGATLVLRKDLDLRLDGLAGRTVAVAGRRCRLLHQFLADTERLGVDPGAITLAPMPFDQMVPTLEARKADAILTRGGHALLAVAQDHKVLYQNWDVTGEDECCPKTLAQVELVLVTRAKGMGARRVRALVAALEAGSAASSDNLRAAVSVRTRIPLSVLEPFPVASFAVLTPEQQAELGSTGTVEEEDEHDPDCEHEGCDHRH